MTDLTAISQPGWYGKNCEHFKIINLKEKKRKEKKRFVERLLFVIVILLFKSSF